MRNILIYMLLITLPCSAQVIEGTWCGALNMGVQKLNIVFHFDNSGGIASCKMDSPDQGAKGIPAVVHYLSADSVSVGIPQLGVKYSGSKRDGIIHGTFTQMTFSMPLTLTPGAIVRQRPQHPVEPYPYVTEEVTIKAPHDVTLAGTLTFPVGYAQGRKVPVVLLISGSGQQNRDEEIFEHKPFLVIADHLARNGIATLRCDDRGCGKSAGDAKNATTEDFASDAAACIEFLRVRKQFNRVGVLGHSEGASIAFMLGAKQKVDFVISVAGIGVRGDEALTAQVNKINALMGVPVKVTVEQYRQTVQKANNPWLNYFAGYDPAPHIRATQCPVMALNGDKDVQVISSLNLPAIREVLPANKRNIAKEYPNLNHLMQTCTTGLPAEYANIEETFSPEVLKDIVSWIKCE